MDFTSDQELCLFLHDKPYCMDKTSYCLGNSFEEAAEIIKELMKKAEMEEE